MNKHKNAASHKRKVDPAFAIAEEAEKAAKKAASEADTETNKATVQAAKMAKKDEAEKEAAKKREAEKEAATAAKKDEFFCSICGNGHDFKTLQNLKKHEKTASHKRKLDPEFAAAEEAKNSQFRTHLTISR